MPFKNFHSVRLNRPDKYKGYAYKQDMFARGISAVMGVTGSRTAQVQAIRFDSRKFTMSQVKTWLKKHPQFIPLKIEPSIKSKRENPSKSALLNDYIKNKITIKQLISRSGGLNKIATKNELKMFLNNNFMISVQADEMGVSKAKIIKKIKTILNQFLIKNPDRKPTRSRFL